MPRAFVGIFWLHPAKFFINQRQQLLRGFGIAGVNGAEQLGYVAGHRTELIG
jgi:hypothetical protein